MDGVVKKCPPCGWMDGWMHERMDGFLLFKYVKSIFKVRDVSNVVSYQRFDK